MPIFDYECCMCGLTHEVITFSDDNEDKLCPHCQIGMAHRIISCGRCYTGNEDAPWLKTVPEVINKDTDNPVAKEFIKNPTRSNYKAWMKSEGLRPLENNEPRKPPPTNISKIQKEVWHKFQERHRIEI